MEENSTGFCFFYFIFAPAIQATALGDSMIKNSPKEQKIVANPFTAWRVDLLPSVAYTCAYTYNIRGDQNLPQRWNRRQEE